MTMSVTGDHTSMKGLESSPEIGLTGKVQAGSGSMKNKRGMRSKRMAISEMLKMVKEVVRKRFAAPPFRGRTMAKTVKSSSRPNKKRHWLKYFNRGVRQVGVLDGSCEADWSPDIIELIRWKKMASRVRCPIHKAINESSKVDILKPLL